MHLLKFFSKKISIQSIYSEKRIKEQTYYFYAYRPRKTWKYRPEHLFLFPGPAWNLTMFSWKPIHISRARIEPDNVVLETYFYFQGLLGTWKYRPDNLFNIFGAGMEPDNMVLITYLYFQGLHGTWQCGLGNIFLFSGPAWNLRMWSWKPIHICRAIMEPDNVVPKAYSYF